MSIPTEDKCPRCGGAVAIVEHPKKDKKVIIKRITEEEIDEMKEILKEWDEKDTKEKLGKGVGHIPLPDISVSNSKKIKKAIKLLKKEGYKVIKKK